MARKRTAENIVSRPYNLVIIYCQAKSGAKDMTNILTKGIQKRQWSSNLGAPQASLHHCIITSVLHTMVHHKHPSHTMLSASKYPSSSLFHQWQPLGGQPYYINKL